MMSAFGFTKYSFLMSNSVLAHSFLFPLLLPGSFQCRLSLQSSLMEQWNYWEHPSSLPGLYMFKTRVDENDDGGAGIDTL